MEFASVKKVGSVMGIGKKCTCDFHVWGK